MRLDYIKSFIEVVHYRSFSIASKNLFLSQPTISVHIKQLEKELGVRLVARSTKEVLLTEEGRLFYPFALQLLETESKAFDVLKGQEDIVGGTVTIAVATAAENVVLPTIVSKLRKENTGIHFIIKQGDSGNVLQKLLNYDAEIGIGSLISDSNKIHSELMYEDEIVLITPNTAKYRSMEGKMTKEQLKKEYFIVRENGSGTQAKMEKILHELKINYSELDIIAQFESSDFVCKAVAADMGIAFVSRKVAEELIHKHQILEFTFDDIDMKNRICFMYHKERAESRAMACVVDYLREYQ